MQGSHFKHYVVALSHRHGALVLVQTLVAIANTLANSFALIYLIKLDMSYLQCATFILICAAVPLVLTAFASRTIVANFSYSINTALISLTGYYVLLILLRGWALVLIPPILFGIYIVTFWVPYNALIMHITSKKKRGAAIGAYFLIFPLVSVVTPLAGGAIISALSYEVLFIVGGAFVVLNLIVVSGMRVFLRLRARIIIPELLQSLKVNMIGKLQMDLVLKPVDWRLRIALFGEGVQDGVFWVFVPLVSFEFAKNELSLGGYLSLFAFWGAIMTVALGYLSDRLKDRAHIVRIGATFAAVSILLASMASTAEQFAASMSMAFLFVAIIHSFLFTMLLDKMEKLKKKGVLVREFLLNAGRTCGILTVILALLLGFDLSISMVVAGIAMASIVIVK
jgi:MFS family permease